MIPVPRCLSGWGYGFAGSKDQAEHAATRMRLMHRGWTFRPALTYRGWHVEAAPETGGGGIAVLVGPAGEVEAEIKAAERRTRGHRR